MGGAAGGGRGNSWRGTENATFQGFVHAQINSGAEEQIQFMRKRNMNLQRINENEEEDED